MTPDPPPAKRSTRSTRKKREPWKPKFIAALRTVPNVRAACEAADIDRSLAYQQRQRDEAFALAWHDALEEGLDAMERIAHVRATAGQRMTKTKTVTRKLASGDVEETTTTEHENHISDILLMFLLKRYRPEFRESFRVENTGPDGGPMQHEVTRIDEAAKAFYARLDELGQPDAPE